MDQNLGLDFTNEQLENVRHLLASKAWTDFFLPELKKQREVALIHLADPSRSRKDDLPDDYLRGMIQVLDRVMTVGYERLEEKDQLQLQQDQESRMSDAYQDRVATGHIGPVS